MTGDGWVYSGVRRRLDGALEASGGPRNGPGDAREMLTVQACRRDDISRRGEALMTCPCVQLEKDGAWGIR